MSVIPSATPQEIEDIRQLSETTCLTEQDYEDIMKAKRLSPEEFLANDNDAERNRLWTLMKIYCYRRVIEEFAFYKSAHNA